MGIFLCQIDLLFILYQMNQQSADLITSRLVEYVQISIFTLLFWCFHES